LKLISLILIPHGREELMNVIMDLLGVFIPKGKAIKDFSEETINGYNNG